MTYEEWEATISLQLRSDRLWRMRAYRLAWYLSDVGWPDAQQVATEPLMRDIAGQLFTALGSIRANLGEGYSRSGGRDRARTFEYALGSAREAHEWYRHAAPALAPATVVARTDVFEEIVRLLLATIPRERDREITRVAAHRASANLLEPD